MNMSTNVKDFPQFGKLTDEEYRCRLLDFMPYVEHVFKELKHNWSDISYNKDYISEIVDLVQRRRVYFHIYHHIEMGELNEACLYCFWILKLNPFYHTKNPNCNVNLAIAIALFTRAVNYAAKKKSSKANFTEEIVEHLRHAFIYRDLSKESIMAIALSLIYS